jgi:molybdopterin synthase catalytic subunit
VEITEQPLDLLKLTQRVTDPAAGAISTFIGTTRNNFDNKAVLYLEYEAYVPMAVAKLKVGCATCLPAVTLLPAYQPVCWLLVFRVH